MGELGLAAAFTFGMLATVNPCALPMLPAYLSWFISGDESDTTTSAAVARAGIVALAVSAGFVTVFGTLGMAVTAASAEVEKITPWITPLVGVTLIVLGGFLLAGRTLKVPLPRLDHTGGGRGLVAMFLYGVSYAIVSVSCSIQLFVGHVATSFGEAWTTGLVRLGAFALGFALVLTALSMSVALAQGSVAQHLHRAAPYVGRISGGLFVLTGLYLVWYGTSELRVDSSPSDPVTERVWGWSFDIRAWVETIGGVELGLALGLVIAVVALVAVLRTGPRRTEP